MTRRVQRGTSAVELALTLPVMLPLVFGAIEYGWYHAHHGLLESAVASSCRSASLVNPRRANPVVVAHEKLSAAAADAGVDCADPSVTCAEVVSGYAPMERLSCRLETPYHALTGLVPVPEAIVVTASARLEFQQ